MAELAARAGLPVPADLPRGYFVYTALPDGRIRIGHADPRILISGELFEEWHDEDDSAMVALRCTCEGCPDRIDPALHCPIGDVVTIHGTNRTVIYCIAEYVPSVHGYIGQWPD